jgi:hypothetical protein
MREPERCKAVQSVFFLRYLCFLLLKLSEPNLG